MPEPGYVYFLYAIGTYRIKIGRTGQLVKRLRQLDREDPSEKLQLLYAEHVTDMVRAEQVLHRRYAEQCLYGERFEFSSAFIDDGPAPKVPYAYTEPVAPPAVLARIASHVKRRCFHNTPDDAHAYLAWMQRQILRWLLFEYRTPVTYEQIERVFYQRDSMELVPYVLEQAILLKRLCLDNLNGQWRYRVREDFMPCEEWADRFMFLVATPKFYNRLLDDQIYERLKFEAQGYPSRSLKEAA